MSDYESKLKMTFLSKRVELSSKLNPLLNNIYKEEYYSKMKDINKKMILLRCQNSNCYKIFMDSNDYQIMSTKKENKRKKRDNKFKINVKCNKCNSISSFDII